MLEGTDKFYKVYPQFTKFAKILAEVDLQNDEDYQESNRNEIYERLRLPMRMFKGDKKTYIDNIIKLFFDIDNYYFSIIDSNGNSKIHSDVFYKKESQFQRYCNFAFPLSGNFNNRKTYWPKLEKAHGIEVFRWSQLSDEHLDKYLDSKNWLCSIKHKQYQPVLLNTTLPHGVIGEGSSLFAYITIPGKTYEDCAALYDSISNSATI